MADTATTNTHTFGQLFTECKMPSYEPKLEINKFQRAAEAIQAILDYLHENHGVTCPELAAALGRTKNSVANWLLKMDKLGEIRREPFFYRTSVSGHYSYRLYPLVRETVFWQTMEAKANNTKNSTVAFDPTKRPSAKKSEPWRTVNMDPNRPPLKNQGGQGAGRINGWYRQEAPSWT